MARLPVGHTWGSGVGLHLAAMLSKTPAPLPVVSKETFQSPPIVGATAAAVSTIVPSASDGPRA